MSSLVCASRLEISSQKYIRPINEPAEGVRRDMSNSEREAARPPSPSPLYIGAAPGFGEKLLLRPERPAALLSTELVRDKELVRETNGEQLSLTTPRLGGSRALELSRELHLSIVLCDTLKAVPALSPKGLLLRVCRKTSPFELKEPDEEGKEPPGKFASAFLLAKEGAAAEKDTDEVLLDMFKLRWGIGNEAGKPVRLAAGSRFLMLKNRFALPPLPS